jgi:hypothetical protein
MRQLGLPVFLAILLLGMPLSAQMGRAPVRFSGSPGFGTGHRTHFPRALNLGSAFLSDYFAPYDTSPSVIVVQAPTPPVERPPLQTEEPRPAAPLMIEWQGDRYVRRTAESESDAASQHPPPVSNDSRSSTVAPASRRLSGGSRALAPSETSAASALPPATFIFRDGHREHSSDYSIISGVIYARGDYWSTGSWSKQIPLAQLDLPATFKANQEQGVPFRVPAAPNEVITRP